MSSCGRALLCAIVTRRAPHCRRIIGLKDSEVWIRRLHVTARTLRAIATQSPNDTARHGIDVEPRSNTEASSRQRYSPASSDSSLISDQIRMQLQERAAEADDTTAKRVDGKSFILQHKINPTPVFPWRHSSEPLSRLIPGSAEYFDQGGYLGPCMPPFNRTLRCTIFVGAALLLKIPLWKVIFWKHFWWDEDEVGASFALAFQSGVLGMLTNSYHVPMNEIVDRGKISSFAIDFDHVVGPVKSIDEHNNDDTKKSIEKKTDSVEGTNYKKCEFEDSTKDETFSPATATTKHSETLNENKGNDKPIEAKNQSSVTAASKVIMKDQARPSENDEEFDGTRQEVGVEEDEKEAYPEPEYMLEQNLRALYQSAHKHAKSKLQIKLQSQPTSAHLVSLMVVPFLTRKEVTQTPALRHTFLDIVKRLIKIETDSEKRLGMKDKFQAILNEVKTLAHRQTKENGVLEFTVIAQVAIDCQEVFTVRDVELNEVIQGDADGRVNQVTHLVRFEMVVKINIEDGLHELGSWQITDWDDILNGNMWFTLTK